MSYGYSARLVKANEDADTTLLGVRLGRRCIEGDVSVKNVAEYIGVSRQTIYNWFSGVSSPLNQNVARVETFINSLA